MSIARTILQAWATGLVAAGTTILKALEEDEVMTPDEWLESLRKDYHEPGEGNADGCPDDCYWCWVDYIAADDDPPANWR